MREKVIISDITSLHICPSRKWGTLEKKALNDCLYLRDCGANPIILCNEGSLLDIEAKKESIKCIYPSILTLKKRLNIQYLIEINKILNDHGIDIVHSYHLASVWGLAWMLRRKPLQPLILTTDTIPSRKLKSVIYKWPGQRIDSLVCFSSSDKDFLVATLPIPLRKMRFFGMGVDPSSIDSGKEVSKKIIGTYIDFTYGQEKTVQSFLHNIERLLFVCEERNLKIAFHFFFKEGCEDSPVFKTIQNYINDKKLSDTVHLATTTDFSSILNKIHIYLSLDKGNMVSYEEMMCLMGQKFVLMPRTAARVDLLSAFGGIAQTYGIKNNREIISKLLYLLEHDHEMTSNIKKAQQSLIEEHNAERYINEFFGLYVRLLQGRKRVTKSKI